MEERFRNLSKKELIEKIKSIAADLNRADLRDANLRDANLRDANLISADLRDADLSGADLRDADLRDADLSDADLSGANLRYANLISADLRDANLISADLSGADLNRADLRDADLIGANLRYANLSGADLRGANLRYANLISANLSGANLRDVDLRGANLRDVDLRGANFSNAKNIFNQTEFIENNFKFNRKGLIVYKAFGKTPSNSMKWGTPKVNKIITEVVNPCITTMCGSGINVATLKWIEKNLKGDIEIWECLIPYKHLIGLIVPYNSDGKIRCNYLKLIKKISEKNE